MRLAHRAFGHPRVLVTSRCYCVLRERVAATRCTWLLGPIGWLYTAALTRRALGRRHVGRLTKQGHCPRSRAAESDGEVRYAISSPHVITLPPPPSRAPAQKALGFVARPTFSGACPPARTARLTLTIDCIRHATRARSSTPIDCIRHATHARSSTPFRSHRNANTT